jgi:hypothetical protein
MATDNMTDINDQLTAVHTSILDDGTRVIKSEARKELQYGTSTTITATLRILPNSLQQQAHQRYHSYSAVNIVVLADDTNNKQRR